MKIAVGTDDGKTLCKDPFCKSPYFVVMEILNAKVVGREARENRTRGQKAEQGYENIEAVMDLLGDCSLFMGSGFGKDAVEEISSRGIDCISTHMEGIDDAVCAYLDNKVDGFRFYSRDKKEHLPCTQRPYL